MRSDHTEMESLSSMELSSMPLDPIYAWGIVLEPVEVMIEETSMFVAHLARQTMERDEPFSDGELERRFLAFFERLVEEGTLRRPPDAPPEMEVHPETYELRADGELLTCAPAHELPMAQRYFLF